MDWTPPTCKYYGERGGNLHPGPVHWPGINGLPFLGDAIPNLRQSEMANLPVVGFKRVKQFDLSDEAALREYTEVMDRERSGQFTVEYIDRHKIQYEDQDGIIRVKWIAHVEWTQLYRTLPPSTYPGGGNGYPGRDFFLGG